MADLFDEVAREILVNRDAPDNYVPYNSTSNAAEASHVAATGLALLYGFTVSNANAAARFILLFDAASVPANGAVPVASFQVAITATVAVAFIPPRRMDRGIVMANSTTQNTLTLGTADSIFDIQYI